MALQFIIPPLVTKIAISAGIGVGVGSIVTYGVLSYAGWSQLRTLRKAEGIKMVSGADLAYLDFSKYRVYRAFLEGLDASYLFAFPEGIELHDTKGIRAYMQERIDNDVNIEGYKVETFKRILGSNAQRNAGGIEVVDQDAVIEPLRMPLDEALANPAYKAWHDLYSMVKEDHGTVNSFAEGGNQAMVDGVQYGVWMKVKDRFGRRGLMCYQGDGAQCSVVIYERFHSREALYSPQLETFLPVIPGSNAIDADPIYFACAYEDTTKEMSAIGAAGIELFKALEIGYLDIPKLQTEAVTDPVTETVAEVLDVRVEQTRAGADGVIEVVEEAVKDSVTATETQKEETIYVPASGVSIPVVHATVKVNSI